MDSKLTGTAQQFVEKSGTVDIYPTFETIMKIFCKVCTKSTVDKLYKKEG